MENFSDLVRGIEEMLTSDDYLWENEMLQASVWCNPVPIKNDSEDLLAVGMQ